VSDALILLAAFGGADESTDASTALGLLALVAGQDVEQDVDGTWKIAQRVAPDRIISTVDPEARHMHKSRSEYRDGYKAHVAIEPETGLITAAALTPANFADGPTGLDLLSEEEPGLQVLADSAYGSGEVRAGLKEAKHVAVIKPIPLRSAVVDGFTLDDFTIDTERRTATCPNGITVAITPKGTATFGAQCQGCPQRHRCTTRPRGRTLNVRPHHDLLAQARRQARTAGFQTPYRQWRPMVERSIAWLVASGNRRVRFRGVARNQLGLSMRVAAINLRRLVNLGLAYDKRWVLASI
jgi:IS5 family transposase